MFFQLLKGHEFVIPVVALLCVLTACSRGKDAAVSEKRAVIHHDKRTKPLEYLVVPVSDRAEEFSFQRYDSLVVNILHNKSLNCPECDRLPDKDKWTTAGSFACTQKDHWELQIRRQQYNNYDDLVLRLKEEADLERERVRYGGMYPSERLLLVRADFRAPYAAIEPVLRACASAEVGIYKTEFIVKMAGQDLGDDYEVVTREGMLRCWQSRHVGAEQKRITLKLSRHSNTDKIHYFVESDEIDFGKNERVALKDVVDRIRQCMVAGGQGGELPVVVLVLGLDIPLQEILDVISALHADNITVIEFAPLAR